jgi:lincosamide nucleotidyltransferase A/C/D/E
MVRGSRVTQRLKRRVFELPSTKVPELMAALEEAGVRTWLIGGWAVDALVGAQTRRHLDLDLAFDAAGDAETRAIAVLASLGFAVVKREPVKEATQLPFRLVARIVLDDRRRHLVDLHPVVFTAPVDVDAVTTEGRIDGRRVLCLRGPLQLRLREGYAPREFDDADVTLLRAQIERDGDRD